jgi:hypothetical protein
VTRGPLRRGHPARRARRRGGRRRELRVLLEDPLLERPQLVARLDPELVDEQPAAGGECRERLGLAPGAVEREHQLAAQALAVRMLGDQLLELGDHLAVAAEREARVDVVLDGREPQLLEPPDRLLRERLVAQVRERGARPDRERRAERVGRLLGPAGGQRGAPGGGEPLEARQIELVRPEPRDVSGALGDDHARRGAIGLDQLAQLRHVTL